MTSVALRFALAIFLGWTAVAREIDLVNTFVVPQKRARYAGFVSSPKTRPKLLRALYYFSDFDPARVVQFSAGTRTAEGLLAELRRRGESGVPVSR